MASRYLQKFPIPEGFQEILADFTKEVLKEQPHNIIQFAAKYFENLQKGRAAGGPKSYQTLSEKQGQQITKRASNIAQKLSQLPKQ